MKSGKIDQRTTKGTGVNETRVVPSVPLGKFRIQSSAVKRRGVSATESSVGLIFGFRSTSRCPGAGGEWWGDRSRGRVGSVRLV